MTKEGENELRNKIMKGIELAFNRLILDKQRNDGELVFSRNGQIIKVKAKDLIK